MRMTLNQLEQLIREAVEAILLDEGKTKKRKRKGKTYQASAGSVEAIKSAGSAGKAVKSGAFDWATNPWGAAQAANIVATGHATREKKG